MAKPDSSDASHATIEPISIRTTETAHRNRRDDLLQHFRFNCLDHVRADVARRHWGLFMRCAHLLGAGLCQKSALGIPTNLACLVGGTKPPKRSEVHRSSVAATAPCAPDLQENIRRQPRCFHRLDAALDHLLQEERLFASRCLAGESQFFARSEDRPVSQDHLQFVFGVPFHRMLLLAFQTVRNGRLVHRFHHIVHGFATLY